MHKKIIKKIVFLILLIIFILSNICFIINIVEIYHDKKVNTHILENIEIDEEVPSKSELLTKLEKLNKENNDIVGWIQIKDTNINYPVLQTTDNDYYLSHNYLKESSKRGSIFLDKDVNINTSFNYLIYGHRSKTKLMFEDLYNYTKKDFYLKNRIINFATLDNEYEYEIVAVFYSKVYYQNESNVFRYYNYANITNAEDFNYYIEQVKKNNIYNNDIDVKYGDYLLTLSTCEYTQKNGRLVIVAKRIS